MTTLTIRNLDETVIEQLKRRARNNQRSLEAEIRALLTKAASHLTRDEAIALADRIAAMTPKDIEQTDSTLLIREDRNR